MSVVKRGNQWCVVHGSPQKPGSKTDKPPGTVIKCFPTRGEALRMHRAIMVNESGDMPMKANLTERSAFGSVRVDKANSIIYNVKILNRASMKKYDYSDRALADVARFAEGAHVFDQHSDIKSPSRKMGDQLGMIRNARKEGDGVVGDLQVSASAGWLLEDAERMPDSMMLSINAEGVVVSIPGRERRIVESVEMLGSVDVVPIGATTKSLFEGMNEHIDIGSDTEESDVDMKTLTIATLREVRPDLLDEHAESVKKVWESEGETAKALADAQQKLTEAAETAKAQKAKLDEFAVRDALTARKGKLETMLTEAKLPDAAVTDDFRKLLESLPDEAAMKAAIADRAKLVETSKSPAAMNRPRGDGSGDDLLTVDQLLESLTR